MGEPKLRSPLNLVQENAQPAPQTELHTVADEKAAVRPLWVTIVGFLVLAALGGAVAMPLKNYVVEVLFYEVTDDAQISGRVSTVSAKVSGVVQKVGFEDYAKVKKGDLLVQLDPREYQAHVDQLVGELSAATATYQNALQERDRSKFLLDKGFTAQSAYDALDAKYKEALGKVWATQARLDQAKLDLEYTAIRAPSDGTVGKRVVEPGMIIRPLQNLTPFVETKDRWIIANFKETQLPRMKLGQQVEIQVDSIDGKTFTGTIESMAPGSGSTFALIPPDNATGNFTKIVQRVPVKILFSPDSIKGYEDRLTPGVSVIARIKVR